MALETDPPYSKDYAEPDPAEIVGILSIDFWGHQVVLRSGYRVRAIEPGEILYEPIKEKGVRRYPPIQVQVPRDSDAMKKYINMGPTSWSDILFNPAE